jgi:hypothetical protein
VSERNHCFMHGKPLGRSLEGMFLEDVLELLDSRAFVCIHKMSI